MYIEDLLQEISNSIYYIVYRGQPAASNIAHDLTVLLNIADRAHGGLTEKQGQFVLRTLNKHKFLIHTTIPQIDSCLADPKWKFPFRVLPTVKKISIGEHQLPAGWRNGKCILIEFPYLPDIVETIRKKNAEMHELHRGLWDANLKQWVFALTERNIDWLGNMLLPNGFQADEEFLDYYNQIKEIHKNIENHLPMVVKTDNGYSISNAHKNVPQISADDQDVGRVLFLAREHGITNWDNDVEKDIEENLHVVTKSLLSAVQRNKSLWIDSTIHPVSVFRELLTYGGPAMIIVPGGNELELVTLWTEFALDLGINADEISVMFRLPNEQAEFNQFVKNAGLNNPVDNKTRLIFVSTKITKPLIKSGVKFNTVINLGYYNYMHFTMSTVVDNATNLVYYSMKAPTKNNKWQQHEL
jgi:hypothetical protein